MLGLLLLVCLSTTPFEKDKGFESWILDGEISKSDSWVVLTVKLSVFGVVMSMMY